MADNVSLLPASYSLSSIGNSLTPHRLSLSISYHIIHPRGMWARLRRSSFVVRRSSFVVVRPALLLHRNKQLAAPPGHPLLDEDEDFQGHIESYTDEGHRWFDGDDVSLVSLIYGCFGIATALYVV